MVENSIRSQSAWSRDQIAARASVGLSGVFLALLFLLHFLEPEFDPSWRMISEYELGRFGFLMSLAFFCWGGSVLALNVALWPYLRTRSGMISRVWLWVIVAALFGAGIFITNSITEDIVTPAHIIHAACGAIVIITFPVAASLAAGSLARNQAWNTARGRLLWMTLLLWISMLAFFGTIIVTNAINPDAGRNGSDVLLGWPNRFNVLTYHLWLIVVGLHVVRLPGSEIGEARSK